MRNLKFLVKEPPHPPVIIEYIFNFKGEIFSQTQFWRFFRFPLLLVYIYINLFIPFYKKIYFTLSIYLYIISIYLESRQCFCQLLLVVTSMNLSFLINYLPINLSNHPSIYLFIYLSIYLFSHLSRPCFCQLLLVVTSMNLSFLINYLSIYLDRVSVSCCWW